MVNSCNEVLNSCKEEREWSLWSDMEWLPGHIVKHNKQRVGAYLEYAELHGRKKRL